MLVTAPERWDEACFCVPVVRALMASGLGLGVVCREAQKGFWETLNGLEVLAFPASAKPKVAAAQIKNLWQAALLWEPGFAADAVRIANVDRRLGPALPYLKPLLTHPLEISENPLEHRVRHYLSTAEQMGVRCLNPQFFAPAAMGIEPSTDAVLICPDSDFGPSHEWLLERWVGIGRELVLGGRKLTVAGLAGGRGLGKRLSANLGVGVAFFEASPMAAALPVLAGHHLVIAADGSLPHLAAHAGATCVTLFGPNDPLWKRPLGKRHAVVRKHVECAPCLLEKCPMDMRCQNELDYDRVWSAVRDKLG